MREPSSKAGKLRGLKIAFEQIDFGIDCSCITQDTPEDNLEMLEIPNTRMLGRRLGTLLVIISLVAVTSAFAQTAPKKYDVEMAVSDGKKTVETDSVLIFNEKTFQVVPEKRRFQSSSKDIAYADINAADASFAKKPMLSGGGAIATALLLGFIFALPFLFIKKKKHWMTVRTEKDFAVLHLGDNNWRQIAAEFETHGVKVTDLKEEGK